MVWITVENKCYSIWSDCRQRSEERLQSDMQSDDLDHINLIPCEIDPESNPFCDTKIFIYKIELPNSRNKIGFNLLDDEYFTIPYVIDKISNSPDSHQPPTH